VRRASVTANYSHGDPRDLKRDLLTKWSDHVAALIEGIVNPDREGNVVSIRA
jgi:hypothetical protein